MNTKAILLSFLFILGVIKGQQPQKLTEKQKTEVIQDLSLLLSDHYVFPDTAARMVAFLKKQLKSGAYKKVNSPPEFSDLINRDLNSIYKDGHLQTQYNPAFAEQLLRAEIPKVSNNEEELKRLRNINFGLNKVEILKGNIGYLNISQFVNDHPQTRETIKSAMKFLSNSNALIIDLRNCSGGSPKTVSTICGYFFKERTHLNDTYNRSANSTIEYWTSPDTSFRSLFTIPLYVLTDNSTFSASEELCYDLRELKRATLVGEKTGGGAHNTFEQATRHGFVVFIPYGRAINPITKTNWEKVGIIPDIQTTSEKALEVAEMEIFKQLLDSAKNEKELYDINWQYELLKAINHPVTIDTLTLKKYAGIYDQRVFTYENGKLFYQRTGKPKFELEAMTKTIMKGKNNEYFKIEFIETNGEITEVKVYYQDQRIESSKRNPR